MKKSLTLEKYSLGVGDRFARQAEAQLRACMAALEKGVEVIPVWNKSNREHVIIGSQPVETRTAADADVTLLGWTRAYYVDADHIGLKTVDRFIPYADFYTIDVADCIGKPAPAEAIADFATRHSELVGQLAIPGMGRPFELTAAQVRAIAGKYLLAVQEAGKVYRHIVNGIGEGSFITEVSLDETDTAQTPPELLVILAALSDEGIPAQTVAPKFTGQFNKGVDYVGEVATFEREFNDDLAVIAYAVKQYGLPANLKLSVHSGSDKFSLYGPIRRAIRRFNAGVHLKTAGTTWLEEIIGMAEAGDEGLLWAKKIYTAAISQVEDLCVPYATVINIQKRKLPPASLVQQWSAEQFVAALRHDPKNPAFDPNLRQLFHIGYQIVPKLGRRYFEVLEAAKATVARNVTYNLYERHIKPLFLEAE